ncbi:MAG: YeeE/YedE family protein [Betaproteobacteria bacterium]|nr:MAG: YeeE/YedE family protein [Betaproteobacteria bacterium]
MARIVVFLAGVVFAAGLVIGGMTDPKKVQAFLDIGGIASGRWDPSLAFVMGGALMVAAIAFALLPKRKKPWFATGFDLPTVRRIDKALLAGAALFGVGWGLAGYCPGPAVASLTTGGMDIALFLPAMLVGMVLTKRFLQARAT